ncbi:MAG: outer membrane protein, partial [Sphingomonas sp.]
MRKLAVALALSTTALASPALARDHSWYVGVEGGPNIVEDINYDIAGVSRAGTVNSDYGYTVDGVTGYDFGAFRLEAEVGYQHASLDSYASTLTTPAYTTGGLLTAAPAGTYNYAGGSTSALSFMVNGLLDFGSDDGIQGFVGGGAGVARIKASGYALNTNGPFLDDSDTVFAWQGIAGIRAPISDHVDVSLKYKFFNADNVKM